MNKKLKVSLLIPMHILKLLSNAGQVLVSSKDFLKYAMGSATSAPALVYFGVAEYGSFVTNALKCSSVHAYFVQPSDKPAHPVPVGLPASTYKYAMKASVMCSNFFTAYNAEIGTVAVIDTAVKLGEYLFSDELAMEDFPDEFENPSTTLKDYHFYRVLGIYLGALLLGAIPAAISYFGYDRALLFKSIDRNAELLDQRDFAFQKKHLAFALGIGTANIVGSVALAYFFTQKGLQEKPFYTPDAVNTTIMLIGSASAGLTGTAILNTLYAFTPTKDSLPRSTSALANTTAYSGGGFDSVCAGLVAAFAGIIMVSEIFKLNPYDPALIVCALLLVGLPTAAINFIFNFSPAWKNFLQKGVVEQSPVESLPDDPERRALIGESAGYRRQGLFNSMQGEQQPPLDVVVSRSTSPSPAFG